MGSVEESAEGRLVDHGAILAPPERSCTVERLTGLDASFLYNETPSLHMHTLKYAVLDVTLREGEFSIERLRAELGDRLHLLPQFRRRIVEVPLGLHHPVWIEDARFRLTDHVRSG